MKSELLEQMLAMPLHSVMEISRDMCHTADERCHIIQIMRVPSGWIYDVMVNHSRSHVFVSEPQDSKPITDGIDKMCSYLDALLMKLEPLSIDISKDPLFEQRLVNDGRLAPKRQLSISKMINSVDPDSEQLLPTYDLAANMVLDIMEGLYAEQFKTLMRHIGWEHAKRSKI